jgi:hypothetical protein
MARSPDPGAVAKDPVDDAAWMMIISAHAREGPPDWLFPEEHPPDPEDPDAWPGDFAATAALAEAEGTDDGEWRETLLAAGIGTGWAHYPGADPVPGVHEGPGGGFGQGQAHDVADPEPRLAALADDAAGPDREFTGVGDDELMGLIGARNRLSSRQAWELLTALAELIRRRPAPYCPPEGAARMPRVWAEGTSAEVSIQLAVTRHAAAELLGLAYDLAAKLPRTAAALRDGVIDDEKAQIIASWCATLDEIQARQAEDLLFGQDGIESMTWSMIRDRIARAVMTIDPDAARKRRDRGTKDARVETKLEQSGNMQIAAREIPPATALALDKKLTDRARQLKKAGIKGTMSRLRVLAYLERWGILDPFTVPRPEDGIGAGPLSQDDQDRNGQNQDSADGNSGDQDSADRDGGEPLPEDWPKDDGRGREHRDGDDPDGDDSDDGPDDGPSGGTGDGGPGGGSPPSAGGPDGGGIGPCGGGCGCGGTPPAGTGTGGGDDGMAGWLHLTVPASTLLEHGDRAGQLSKLGPVDADLARHLADKIAKDGHSDICVTLTGPDGRPIGHACGHPARGDPATRTARKRKQDPLGTPALQDPANPALTPLRDGSGYGTWRLTYAGRDLDLDFEPLTGPCDHRHQTAAHDPGKHLKHLTAVLHQDCTFGTCRTPQHRSDYEHAIAWPEGRTCTCNGHPCCRRNHQDKQSDGWDVHGTGEPGHFTWTFPSGRSYLSKPTSYPT